MRIYEELFIVQPDATDEQVDPIIEQLKGIVTQSGGTIEKSEKWGVRRLAYRVLKFSEGQYILLQFTAKPETVKELERRLRVNDLVIKFLTVRIDEKLKRIEKRKKAAREACGAQTAKTGKPGGGGPRLPVGAVRSSAWSTGTRSTGAGRTCSRGPG